MWAVRAKIKKIENTPSEEISNNCNILMSHIILNKLVRASRRWGYKLQP